MSRSPQGAPRTASTLVRVTVTSATRRVDLVLPGVVPVAELVPELARSVGLLDTATVFGGYKITTSEGRVLGSDEGLRVQGVRDGSVLTVTAGVDEAVPVVYDDVVEAMTDVVERDLRPWQPAASRRTALWSAGLLLTLGAAALLVDGSDRATAAASLVAAALVVAAIVLGRAHDEPEAAVAVAWMGTGYASVAGFLAAPADPLLGYPLLGYPMAAAGAAASAAGLVALLSLSEGRSLLIPPAAGGALLGIAGLAIETWDLSGPRVLTAALVAVVLVGSLLPWLALGATGTRVEQMYSEADVSRDPERLDAAAIAADARLAHEILVAVSGCVGLLLVLIAPWATRLGAAGTMLAVTCCAVVMLRTRQYRTGAEVGVGLVSGVLGLAVVAASVLVWHPSWRPGAAMVLAVTGAVLLAATLMPSAPSIRRGRLGDVAESVALLALLPLTVVATGLFDAIRG